LVNYLANIAAGKETRHKGGDNMKRGWICLHRQIQDHWLWEDRPFSRGQAWIDLLMLANHEDKKMIFDGIYLM
jgi:hypothetical protein